MRDPEIGHDRLVVAIHEDVRGFEIAVDHAVGVGVFDGPGDPEDDAGGLAGRDPRVSARDPAVQLDPLDQLGRDVGLAPVGLPEVVDPRDVGVAESAGADALESAARCVLGAAPEDLDRHERGVSLLTECPVRGLIHRALAPAAQDPSELVSRPPVRMVGAEIRGQFAQGVAIGSLDEPSHALRGVRACGFRQRAGQ